MPKKYKGWNIEFTGHGYELSKPHPVTHQMIKTHAKTLSHAKTIITNYELRLSLEVKHDK